MGWAPAGASAVGAFSELTRGPASRCLALGRNGIRGCRGGASGNVAVARHTERDGGIAPLDHVVDLCEFVLGGGKTDSQSFGFADPAFALGFVDAVDKVVADVEQPLPLIGIDAQQRATDATVFVDAAGAVGPPAITEGESAAFEVPEEFVPFRIGGASVLIAGRSARRRAMNARWPLMAS